ncbi:MAG TPA: DUF6478 family protein [Paracoccaceae bacterium]|nr:DUF6478 family protein [Paracoccaceae bacterium]
MNGSLVLRLVRRASPAPAPRPAMLPAPSEPSPGWAAVPGGGPSVAGEPVYWTLRPRLFARPLEGAPSGPVADGTGFGPGASFHHDGAPGTISARQCADPSAPGGQALAIEMRGFAGRYFSLAAALPDKPPVALTRASILDAVAEIAADGPFEAVVRIHLDCGVNRERWMRPLLLSPKGLSASFDLAFLPPPGPQGGWVDLIFGRVGCDRIRLLDFRLSHRLRADL